MDNYLIQVNTLFLANQILSNGEELHGLVLREIACASQMYQYRPQLAAVWWKQYQTQLIR